MTASTGATTAFSRSRFPRVAANGYALAELRDRAGSTSRRRVRWACRRARCSGGSSAARPSSFPAAGGARRTRCSGRRGPGGRSSLTRRHGARARSCSRSRTRPICSSTKRRSRRRSASARRKRSTRRPPARRARAGRSVRMLALTHLSNRYFGPEIAREARASSPRRSFRGTSISSTSVSRNGAGPRLVKGGALGGPRREEVERTWGAWCRWRWPGDLTEAEEIQAILHSAGIPSELEPAVEQHPAELEDAPAEGPRPGGRRSRRRSTRIEAMTDPDELIGGR